MEQCDCAALNKQATFDTGCHGYKQQRWLWTRILTQQPQLFAPSLAIGELSHLQSLHGLKMREGSRDKMGDSVVVQKPAAVDKEGEKGDRKQVRERKREMISVH